MRVAIVGGGCAGLAAAWELSKCPGYEVEVYEQSFRLGGKGASGRDDNGRIREHGLHVWLGFYENAFRMMRECYREVAAHGWGPDAPSEHGRLAHASIDDAFFPEPHIGVGGLDRQGAFKVWSGLMPPAEGLPGEPLDFKSNPFTLAGYLGRCLDLVRTLIQSTVAPPTQAWTPAAERTTPASTEELVDRIATFLKASALTSAAALLQAVTLIEQWVDRADRSTRRTQRVTRVLLAVAAQARKLLADVVAIDDSMRWKTEMVDIVMAIAVGLIRDRVLFRRDGFDAINGLDYRAWLARHGATRAALDSRFIAGIYELVFAFEDGDHKRPAFAAGVALRSALRMFFTYRGAMFWRLRSGMGDAVFAPLYKALLAPRASAAGAPCRTPVRFHFLHALRRIELETGADGRTYVGALEFEARENAASGNAEAVALDHFGCWPIDARRLVDGPPAPGRPKRLEVECDFDVVVVATGSDDFAAVLRGGAGGRGAFEQLPEHWSRMAESTRTVATQCAQVWLDADFKTLGWHDGPGITTALGLGFDTWADMTHTLATERAWRRASGRAFAEEIESARAVAYFCSVLPERDVLRGREAVERSVAQSLHGLLTRKAQSLWPRAFDHRLTALHRLAEVERVEWGHERLTEHVQINSVGSERYTLSTPGSIAHRISPLDGAVANLTIAGDWTACGLDAGCVEAAVMSGKLAAHAVTGDRPALASIVGYDHP